MEDKPIRVLLVEDNPGDARLLREMLAEVESAQFELTHVDRVGAALQRLSQERFDVVLSDLGLPDSLGLETFTRIHSHAPDVPIVVLTSMSDETLAVRAVQEGAQDYLVKGQRDGNLLVRSLRYAIERQRTLYYRALMMEREHFDMAVAQMSDGIVVADGDWRITTANHTACLLLNLPEGGRKGAPLDDALKPFALSPSLDELRSSQEPVTPLEIARSHTKPPLFLDARLTRLFDHTKRLVSVVLTLRDVTAERHAQHVRANFFMMVSHKLRTPLTVLGGYLHLCRRLPPERMMEQLPQVLEVCSAEVRQLGEIVQQLLEFKVASARQLEAQAQQTEVAAVASAIAEEVRRRYPCKQVEITTEIAADAARAGASAEHVGLVLEKLLDNAAKFGDKDPVRIHLKVERKEPSWLRFAVSDNGLGIPHEYYDRVFEGFVQVEDRVTGQVPGLGIGLAMARQVVEAYQGAISIRSRIGEGSTISFTLPAAARSRATNDE